MLYIKQKSLYSIFFVILLVTEFYYIEIGNGVARIYHFLAPLICLSLYRYVPRLLVSKTFWALIGFLIVNILAALFADESESALVSLASLAANISVAIAVALILASARYEFDDLIKLILVITIVATLFGLLQVILHKFAGVDLALSEAQVAQINAGFAPAFRTEANTFAKYLNFVFILALPRLFRSENYKKSIMIFVILAIGMLINLTRSALYGLSITLLIAYFWYLFTGRGKLLSPRVMTFLGLGVVSLLIFSVFVGEFNEYAAHKITNFFSKEEILEGGSSGFRLMSQGYLIDAFIATEKSILIGNGWGQVYFDYIGMQWQAGGAEILTALAYGGILSGFFYLMYSFSAINISHKLLKIHPEQTATYEGMMFAVLGSVITGQINGAMIAPEYWLMYGVAIYFGYKLKTKYRHSNKNNHISTRLR